MSQPRRQASRPLRLPSFRMGRPQRWAAVLLACLALQCGWVIAHQTLSAADYRYARCGRETWERPSPLAGYYTTCGNLGGDGIFAYRVAGLPLTLERLVLQGADLLRKPENRRHAAGSLGGSTWEARHETGSVKWLLHLPFAVFALWLGGGLWWVARRLFGDEGGFLALALYCFCPAVVAAAVVPNNEVLAMWGLYGLVYTAIGVAHALAGPRRKWRPRIVLFALALGLTAAAHVAAAIVGVVAALGLMLWVAERRRSAVLLIVTYAAIGAGLILFGFYGFRPAPFGYVITGGAGRFSFGTAEAARFVRDPAEWPLLLGAAVALYFFAVFRRARYFGNAVPLGMAVALLLLQTTQVFSSPWVWGLPFLFTFTGGVFADVLETRQRKLLLATAVLLAVTEAVACLTRLNGIALN